MELYDKNKIRIKLFGDSIRIIDDTNAGLILCPLNNITTLLDGLRRMKKDPANYKNHDCFDGHEFFPTIGCEGNFIILSHIPRIITAIKSSNKISFNLNELYSLSLDRLDDINMALRNGNHIIKDNDKIDIIFYNI